MILAGVDEAGYGPILGPLVIAQAAVQAPSLEAVRAAFDRAPLGVRDSKRLHKPGDLRPLESVALPAVAWLCGRRPETASELFALVGEAPEARTAFWQAGAESLCLPVAAVDLPVWSLPGLSPCPVAGAIVHPRELNAACARGINKADLEWSHIARTIERLATMPQDADIAVDRLGGRRYYGDLLTALAGGSTLQSGDETTTACSRYRLTVRGTVWDVSFRVDGERHSPLVATASCIAKYVREVAMILFNRHWGKMVQGLRPTAGYPEDAKRWLAEVGPDHCARHGPNLVRGWASA